MSSINQAINGLNIKDFNYHLPEESIAKYPLEQRDGSKLLFYDGNKIEDSKFVDITSHLPTGAMLVFNNTKVIRARLIFFKESGARIEIFCLEPYQPADYERSLSSFEPVQWKCMIGNAKKWKDGALYARFEHEGENYEVSVKRVEADIAEQVVEFEWNDKSLSFGQMLELLGKIPIPPYLNRESQVSDEVRYQTVYSKIEGSVAAPTAGLHFTETIFEKLKENGFTTEEVTLHVGAGTFLPVKGDEVAAHVMHLEHFDFSLSTIENLYNKIDNIIAVGTTSVRTLESISVLGARVINTGQVDNQRPIGQWEAYDISSQYTGRDLIGALLNYMKINNIDRIKASTSIMITPVYKFKVIRGLVTNFHQPQSTLLLLISAIVGERWKDIYKYALSNNYRFLSYGDSSLLLR